MSQHQEVVWEAGGARIVCLNSFGHVNAENGPDDVLVCGTHCAICGVDLAIHTRPRGVVCHAAGPGLDDAGVSGLPFLDRAGIPAAAVDGATAPIGDGRAIYDRGRVLRVNDSAAALGVDAGMSAKDAAAVMATRSLAAATLSHEQHKLLEDERGRIVGLDSVVHGDDGMNDAVVCLGSHSGLGLAEYLAGFDVRGTIANDAGQPIEGSAVAGLARLQDRGIAAAVVSNATARMGDARSTYQTGVISECNEVAGALGVAPGMRASEAADLMLTNVRTPGGERVESSSSISILD